MKVVNPEKYHHLVLRQSSDVIITTRIGSIDVVNSSEKKLSGVLIAIRLSFDKHSTYLCKKDSSKLYAVACTSPYMNESKLRSLARPIIASQFQYCLSTWMYHNGQRNINIKKIKERTLRFTYKGRNHVNVNC